MATTVNGSPSWASSLPQAEQQSITSLISQLSPAEKDEFTKLLGQIFPSVQGLAQSHDSYTGPNGASSPIGAEYQSLSGSEQSDFNNFVNQIIGALEGGTPTSVSGTPTTPTTNGANGASTGGVPGPTTGGAGGASGPGGSALQQMQYWEDKYQADWSNPATQGQAGQDWQNYLAAAQQWQTGGSTNGAPTTSGSTLPPTTLGAGGTSGGGNTPSSISPTPSSVGPTPTSGTLTQPSSKVWTKDAVQAAEKNNIAGFPSMDQWQSFDDLWAKATPLMKQAGDSDAEIGYIKEGINDEASKTGVDPRIILAQIMQESGGNVRVATTGSPGAGSHANPGLMQSYNGATFDPSDPEGSIKQMIKDGVEGTWDQAKGGGGLGIADAIVAGGSIGAGLRLYNSGSVDLSDLNNGFGATSQYVTQMTHKLTDGNFTS